MKRSLATLFFAALPSLSAAVPLGPFTESIFFGDSFTDGGAGFELTMGTRVPAEIFPNKQITNGDVWATQLGATNAIGFGLTPIAGGTNFAIGGAEAIAEADDESPDLADQLNVYLNSGLDMGTNGLATILIGGNDLGEATDEASARAIGAGVIDEIVMGTKILLDNNVEKVVVMGMPDLGIFPSVIGDGLAPLASAFTPDFNTSLQTALADEFSTEDVMYFDTFSVFDNILKNPGDFGITDTTTACLADQIACLTGDPNTFFFYDTIHPTEVVHTELARAFRAQIAPVPLPASSVFLFAAIGGIFALRRST